MTAAMPTPPAHVAVYVEVLGIDQAVTFLLEFGGSPLYLPSSRTHAESRIVQTIGKDKAVALGQRLGAGMVKVPLAKPFIAAYYLAKDVPVVEIARQLRVTDSTVRRWLPQRPNSQLSLFD